MCEYRKTVLTSIEKWFNRCEYRRVIISGGVSGKSGIRVCTGKLSLRVRKNNIIGVSTEKLLNPEEYQEKVESVRVSENCPDEYRKMVESVWVPENYWIRGSIGKKRNPCEYRKTVLTSTEKWYNRCEYQKVIESGRVSGKSGIRASTGKLS